MEPSAFCKDLLLVLFHDPECLSRVRCAHVVVLPE
jgi:hypothetical protein